MEPGVHPGSVQEVSDEVAANDGRDSVPTLIAGQAGIAPPSTVDRDAARLPRTFDECSQQLLSNGYLIIPIKANEKRPAFSQWQKMRLSALDVPQYAGFGVGILCGVGAFPICAVDTDSTDQAFVDAVRAYCAEHLDAIVHPALERVGQAPKLLLVYRAADAGWSKLASPAYRDLFGITHRVEILGSGQQFVAYGTHPKTGKPYEWVDALGGAAAVHARQLPIVTAEQIAALLAYVDTLAVAEGLTAAPAAHAAGPARTPRSAPAERDALLNYEPPLALSPDAVRDLIQSQDPVP